MGLGDKRETRETLLRSARKRKTRETPLRSARKRKPRETLRSAAAPLEGKQKKPKKPTPYPPRAQHLSSYCLHVASLKSVTGENSATIGLPS